MNVSGLKHCLQFTRECHKCYLISDIATTNGKKCVFPFTYGGVTYEDKCAVNPTKGYARKKLAMRLIHMYIS